MENKEIKYWAAKDGYLVNRDGTIYKMNWNRTGTMRKVKQWQRNDGYLQFNCNCKATLVHRFIAKCFVPNPNNLPEINHKNEIKTDNRVDNLEWCTAKYNANYGTRNKRSGESRSKVLKNDPRLSKKVYQFTKDGELVKEWVSLNEIYRVLDYSIGNISCCCNGKLKQAYGFVWKYAN